MPRRLFTIVGLLALFGLFAGPAALAGENGTDYGPPPGITVDPGDGEITVAGEGCGPGNAVTVTFDGDVVAELLTDDNGEFSVTFDVPDGTAAGDYDVEVAGCGTSVLGANVTIEGEGETLPESGPSDSTGQLVRVGAVLVAVGALLVIAFRRRQAAA